MSISSGSVRSIESHFSDGCPVSPSLLYEQRSLLFETRQRLRQRNAITAYRSYKSRMTVGEAPCLEREDIHEPHSAMKRGIGNMRKTRYDFPRSRTFRLRDKVSTLAMISTSM
jgi:hypothetical protein